MAGSSMSRRRRRTSRPTLPAMAMTLSSVSFPREPMTATWDSRYRPCFSEAIAARAANRETGPRMGNSFQTMCSCLSVSSRSFTGFSDCLQQPHW